MKKYFFCLLCATALMQTSPAYGFHKKDKDKRHSETVTVRIPEPDQLAPKTAGEELVAPIEEVRRQDLKWSNHKYGIDVSRYQNQIDWEAVAKDPNAKYAYLKATEGAGLVDRTYAYNLSEARRVGIKVGCYHFFSPTASVEDQFKNLTSTVDLSTQDLIPIIDVENRGRGSLDEFCNRLRKFLIDVENHYKVKPIIYTSSHFYNKYLRGKFTEYKYMIARYHDEEPVLADNIQFVMWQFTSEGRISGIKGPVDRSKFMDGYSMIDILIR